VSRNAPKEALLILSSDQEASIATEFGDGTQFKAGDTVLHDHNRGTFRRVPGTDLPKA